MSTEMHLGMGSSNAALPTQRDSALPGEPARPVSTGARAEAQQKLGRRMIVAGFVITIAGIFLYCLASFAGGVDADMGDILFENAEPFTRATLGVLGLGTLVWLVGSFKYLKGSMDAEDDAT